MYNTRFSSLFKKKKDFPPHIQKCPDFWQFDGKFCIPDCSDGDCKNIDNKFQHKCNIVADGDKSDYYEHCAINPYYENMREIEYKKAHDKAKLLRARWLGVY